MGPGGSLSQLSYALFLVRDGRIDEAREIVRRAISLPKIDATWIDPVFDELARSPTSAAMHSLLQEYAVQNVIPTNVLVAFWAMAGQADQAMEIAWQLVGNPDLFDIELIYLDEFRVLRQHEDFPQLLDQLGLIDYWRDVGCQWDGDQLSCSGA